MAEASQQQDGSTPGSRANICDTSGDVGGPDLGRNLTKMLPFPKQAS